MDNSGMYIGLDIGTTSIKVIVAEKVKGQMNVLGVGNVHSEGVERGIIIDIDKASQAIQRAAAQAEEKASIQINDVVVGMPSDLLKIEPCSGMCAIDDQSREITDEDVRQVTVSAMTKNLPPEREVIDAISDEFVVDGFDGIQDPRGMVGVRLEMHGRIITGPKTIIHNTKKAVKRAGLNPSSIIVSPLAQGKILLNDGEQDFGSIVIDIGGGQSTASVIHNHSLKYTTVDKEGGDYITKDISIVLNTSIENAEKIKREYGYADSVDASKENEFPIDVVGQSKPSKVSEQLLSEIIQARLDQIFNRLKNKLNQASALDLPGGIILTGGVAALPGISDLAADIFDTNVKVFIPDQMGLRHPSFSLPLALISYRANMSSIELTVRSALYQNSNVANVPNTQKHSYNANSNEHNEPQKQEEAPKKPQSKDNSKMSTRLKNFFSDFFD